MVAVLVRLRFQVLRNTLARNPVQLAAVILGGLLAAMAVAVALAGLLLASAAPPEARQAVVVVGGSALVIGWLVVPLLFDGVERTIDPSRLARFPLRPRTLMAAMFVVGISWVPGIATVAVSIGTAAAWITHPAAAITAVLAGSVGAATCVVASRLVTSAMGALLRGRGAARIGLAALGVLPLALPLSLAAAGRAADRTADAIGTVRGAVEVLGWSPLGAAWSVAGRVATGDLLGAVGAAAVALGTLAGALLVWRLVLSGQTIVRGGHSARTIAGGRLGPFAWMPSSPMGAVASRSLVYWLRDARQARQLILLPVLPVLMLLWWRLFGLEWVAIATGPIVASLLPMSAFAALSYDGTAFGAQIAAGVRGIHDRLGRALALLIIAAPATVAVQVAVAVIIGRSADLPALLGLSLGTLLIAVGVVSVSSARIVVPVARAGRNPFSAQAGSATASILASYAVALATVILLLPVIAVAIAALLLDAVALGWLALAAGIGLGVAAAVGGAVLGGRLLDAEAPAMLARLRLIRA